MGSRYFSDKIVEWYLENRRNLPWRETNDPYKIWLSEIILQQTRVIQGLPYYLKFIERFPDIKALAMATEEEVLRLWQGLGYYTRARNLHHCATQVLDTYDGIFPKDYAALRKLKGIGDYTAAAIASFAFEEPVAVVDGNVFRVLARVFGVEKDISSTDGKKYFVQLANKLINHQQPGLHNQAVMEFGALHCTPVQPLCDSCIFKKTCVARGKSLQTLLPIKNKAKTVRKRYFYYLVMQDGKRLGMKKREDKDIWKGLYDFYLVEKSRPLKIEKICRDEMLEKPLFISPFYKHILSHQLILAKFIVINRGKNKIEKERPFRFYSQKEIGELPKPVLISRFLTDFGIL